MANELIFDSLKTFIGFFSALLLNRLVDIVWREPNEQKQVLQAIKIEALINCNICVKSFRKFYKNGLVLNQFSFETIGKNISAPLFIKNTKREHMQIFTNYLNVIKLCNRYPEFVRNIELSGDTKNQLWKEGAMEEWGNNIKLCEDCIKHVLDLKTSEQRDKLFYEIISTNEETYKSYKELTKKWEVGP